MPWTPYADSIEAVLSISGLLLIVALVLRPPVVSFWLRQKKLRLVK